MTLPTAGTVWIRRQKPFRLRPYGGADLDWILFFRTWGGFAGRSTSQLAHRPRLLLERSVAASCETRNRSGVSLLMGLWPYFSSAYWVYECRPLTYRLQPRGSRAASFGLPVPKRPCLCCPDTTAVLRHRLLAPLVPKINGESRPVSRLALQGPGGDEDRDGYHFADQKSTAVSKVFTIPSALAGSFLGLLVVDEGWAFSFLTRKLADAAGRFELSR